MPPAIWQEESQHATSEQNNVDDVRGVYSNSQKSSDGIERGSGAPWRALFYFSTRANMPVLIAGLLLSFISGAVSPAQSFLAGKVFQGFTSYAAGTLEKDKFMTQEKNYICYLVILAGISWLCLSLELALWIAYGELQAKSARDRLFHGLLRKETEWYDMRKNGIGALLPRLQARIRDLQLANSQPLGILTGTISTAVLSLIQGLVLSWKLTLVIISTVPIVMAAVAWVGGGVQRAFDNQGQKLTEAQKYATCALSSIETVKCFNAQQIEQEKYMRCLKEAARWYYRAASANAMQMGLIVLLSVSLFVQGCYYGGVLVADGKTSTADVITTFMSAVAAFQSLNAILPQLIVLERGRIAGSILRTVMAQVQQKPDSRRLRGRLRPAACYGDIEIRNLTFSYPARPELPAIQNVSMFIPGGDTTFLIGKSGSGKSTLGQLLMAFYSSSQGHITFDSYPLDSLDINWLRSNVTLVEQSTSLFNDTIFRNIALGKHDPDSVRRREVLDAVEFALLQLTISDMPNGLETVVGGKNGGISGGQRQRCALARARLRDTPVLILDEATSALDRISRDLMMEAIREWRQGKTTVIITHDISQILPDDYMYVLKHGKVVQEGYRRDMEKLNRTPSQTFLPEDFKASVSQFERREDNASDSGRSRGLSSDSATSRPSQVTDDILEVQLDIPHYRRSTFLPIMFGQSSPIPALRTSRCASTSPWVPFARSPSSGSPPVQRWSKSWAEKDDSSTTTQPGDTKSSKRVYQDLVEFVEKAGALAADSRKIASEDFGRRRKPVGQEHKTDETGRELQISKYVTSEREKDDSFVVSKSVRQIMSTLWPNINPFTKTAFILGWWGATVHALISPAFSFVLSKLLHLYSIPGGDKHKSLVYSMIILALAVVDGCHTYISHFFLEYVAQRWVDSIRAEAMERILDQPRTFFEKEENAVSRLTGCLDRNAEEMRNLLGRFLSLIWISALMCTVSISWAMVTQWKMTLVALAIAPYIYGVTKAYAMVSERWEKLSNDASEDAAAIFTEVFTNIKTVRAFTLEDVFIRKYIKATNQALAIGFRRALFDGFFFGLSDSASNFSIAMVFYVGTRLVVSGVSVQHIVQVFVMLIITITNVTAILEYIPQIGSSKDTASRLLRLYELPKDSHEHLGHTRILDVGDIVFNDLQFSYPTRPELRVLKHLNLHIRIGTCTAIVGGSGSGKSTIANLLLNLYSTARTSDEHRGRGVGDLLLAGRDIKRIETVSLRSLVVPVSQAPTIFAATVAENISYGLPANSSHNTSASIVAATQQAGIHDFITGLPQGYDTSIGEGGLGVSGGQAQRIAIARALIRQPAVLILDEATAALDVESANLVRQSIENLVRDRKKGRPMTVIIITHSREMMEIAEKVVVLDRGRIVEEGGFQELLTRNGALVNLLSGGRWVGDEEM